MKALTAACAFLITLLLGSNTVGGHRLTSVSGKTKPQAGGSCQVAVQNIRAAFSACDSDVNAIPDACKVWDHNITFHHCLAAIKTAGRSIGTVKDDVSIAIDNCAGAALCLNALHEVTDAAGETADAEEAAVGVCAVPEPVEPEACAAAVLVVTDRVVNLGEKVDDAVDKCTATPVPVTPAPTPTCNPSNGTSCGGGCCPGAGSICCDPQRCCPAAYPVCCTAVKYCCPSGKTCGEGDPPRCLGIAKDGSKTFVSARQKFLNSNSNNLNK